MCRVNINDLKTEQQVFLYLIGMICNPIIINSFVVFVRLYWFEKRFQKVVMDARTERRSRTRTMTEPKDAKEPSRLEHGIRGQSIVVLHNGHPLKPGETLFKDDREVSKSESSSDHEPKVASHDYVPQKPIEPAPTFHREITFADEVRRPDRKADTNTPMLPHRLSPEEHIAFLENQRNPKDKGALRIPGPKDFDRGFEPRQLDEDDEIEEGIEQTETANPPEQKRNITIDEPNTRRLRIDTTASQRYSHASKAHGHDGTAEDATPATSRFIGLKPKTGTFSSIRNWASTEPEPVTPYLSWQPTVGRNSAFVDLTEEQREELGGIEYRSLKTLAVILVGK